MVFGLIPKKVATRVTLFLLLLSVIFLFLWQYQKSSRNYPFYIASVWHSDNPTFTLTYTYDENGVLISSEILEWNQEVMHVEVCFLMREYCVYPKNSSAYEDRLFSGTWRYQDGNLVFFIEEDFLFGNQFSELVFSSMSTT